MYLAAFPRTALMIGHRRLPRISGYVADPALIVLAPLAVFAAAHGSLPRWAVMWAMAVGAFAMCKVLVWRAAGTTTAPRWRRTAFLLAWPGMDAAAFLNGPSSFAGDRLRSRVVSTVACLAVGAMLFWQIARIIPGELPVVRAWIGMVGLILMLHFGTLDLISIAWQRAGVDAAPLMNAPLRSENVAEFWGRRWNTAFRDIASQLLFRPVARRYGVACASWATFLFSGVVHDVVISLPAGGGYGLPTVYFLLQGLAIQFERGRLARRLLLDRPLPRRWFAWAAILGPAGMLFHAPFRNEVILPFMKACGAL